MRKIIGGSLGAEHQSLFHVEVDSGSSPPFSAGLAHVILFVGRGAGTIEVSGRNFDVLQGDGLHVRPNEWFRVASSAGCQLFVSTLPRLETLTRGTSPTANFATTFTDRIRCLDQAFSAKLVTRNFHKWKKV